MASSSDNRSELSRALLEAGTSPADNAPDFEDAQAGDRSSLPEAPLILGSPFPYFFNSPAKKKFHRLATEASLEDGELTGKQPSKLVRNLVAASFKGPGPPPASDMASFTTQIRQDAKKRARMPVDRQLSMGGPRADIYQAIVVGIVNVVVGVPALISYTAIIFQSPEYRPYIGELAQLLFFASAIIQAVFMLKSTLPFSVGQVQDVGLIFLSAMATSIAEICIEKKLPDKEIVGTCLIQCMISTLFVGFMTIIVGKFKLAGLVQYIPLPVVGGYLGYVGFFCIVAGITVSTNMPLENPHDVIALFHSQDAVYMLLAAVASMAVLWMAMELFHHPAALPSALVVVPLAFHAVLLCTGHTLTEAQDSGWVIKPQNSNEPFWEVFKLYNVHDWKLSGTYWPAIVRQIPKTIALFFVVAFGSSMDVAAIQQDMPEPLDFDGELVTVGLANIAASVCCAGFTGSYIFSQTIFTKRQGVFHRLNGWMIAGAELLLFLLPISVVEYMPNFFYGSLLMVFGVDISRDWLYHSFFKVTLAEYFLLLATFLAVVAGGLEVGIGVGLVLATFYFAYEYAKIRVTTFHVVPSSSGALRTYRQQAVLEMFSQRMVAVGLQGYVFFGSALKIGEKVMEVAELLASSEDKVPENLFRGPIQDNARQALKCAPKFLLLDFRDVDGVDATAARTFGTLANQLRNMRIDLVITHVAKSSIMKLLVAHGAATDDNEEADIGKHALCFPSMDAGATFCEECFLEVAVMHSLLEPAAKTMTLTEILLANLETPTFELPQGTSFDKVACDLLPYMSETTFSQGRMLFDEGQLSDEFHIIIRGSVRLEFKHADSMTRLQLEMALSREELTQVDLTKRVYEFGPGGLVGDYDFFLGGSRRFRAVAGSYGCSVLTVNRDQFLTMMSQTPVALSILQAIILRSACMNERTALDLLERAQTHGGAGHR